MKADFKEYWDTIPDDPQEMLTQFWHDRIDKIIKQYNGIIPDDFLCNKDIQFTMFVRYEKYTPIELHYLALKYKFFKLVELLKEDGVGGLQPMNIEGIQTTGNAIHMLYHLTKYASETGTYLTTIKSVIEWGGGFGNLCKIFRRLNRDCTYILIDTKLFAYLQWVYLLEHFGHSDINFGSIEKGKINIIPLGLLTENHIEAEMFISTWAISESSVEAQSYVIDNSMFGASRFLIAHQGSSSDFPVADNVKRFVSGDVYSKEIEHLPGNYYLFK